MLKTTETYGEQTNSWITYPPLRNALLAGIIGLITFLLEKSGVLSNQFSISLYLVAIFTGGYLWALEGIKEFLSEREIGISILMLAATVGAGYLGMWDEAAALVVLYGVAEGIEEYTFNKTRNAIRSLLDMAPKEARIIRDGETVMVPAEKLNIGDKFLVLPGESIPTDGVIIEGASSLDESPVTGESVPVDKAPGDKIFSATINGQVPLTIKVTTRFSDNTLSRIIDLVENAQEQKGRAQEWMERFGRRYSPVVLLVALGLILFPVVIQGDFSYWTEKAVVLLVAAAPCALVISLPIAMAAGISGSAKRGILIKGGAHLEHLGIIRNIAFDKTGTLTYGKPKVTDIVAIENSEEDIIHIAAGLEQYSTHPLAQAVVNYATENEIDIPQADDTQIMIGSGIQGYIDKQHYFLASPNYFQESGVEADDYVVDKISQLQSDEKTVILLGYVEKIIGLVAIQDKIRKNAANTIKQLHDMGITTTMLTGDNPQTAQRVADELGIDNVRAGLKPDDKVKAIQALMQDGPTLMVGDGVNDAPALATATCGVAMGAAGTDAAIEAADIALMADDLSKLKEAMEIGFGARKISRQNIIFSVIILAILIPAGVGGFISVAVAVLVHEASELLAVANGLRAGRSVG